MQMQTVTDSSATLAEERHVQSDPQVSKVAFHQETQQEIAIKPKKANKKSPHGSNTSLSRRQSNPSLSRSNANSTSSLTNFSNPQSKKSKTNLYDKQTDLKKNRSSKSLSKSTSSLSGSLNALSKSRSASSRSLEEKLNSKTMTIAIKAVPVKVKKGYVKNPTVASSKVVEVSQRNTFITSRNSQGTGNPTNSTADSCITNVAKPQPTTPAPAASRRPQSGKLAPIESNAPIISQDDAAKQPASTPSERSLQISDEIHREVVLDSGASAISWEATAFSSKRDSESSHRPHSAKKLAPLEFVGTEANSRQSVTIQAENNPNKREGSTTRASAIRLSSSSSATYPSGIRLSVTTKVQHQQPDESESRISANKRRSAATRPIDSVTEHSTSRLSAVRHSIVNSRKSTTNSSRPSSTAMPPSSQNQQHSNTAIRPVSLSVKTDRSHGVITVQPVIEQVAELRTENSVLRDENDMLRKKIEELSDALNAIQVNNVPAVVNPVTLSHAKSPSSVTVDNTAPIDTAENAANEIEQRASSAIGYIETTAADSFEALDAIDAHISKAKEIMNIADEPAEAPRTTLNELESSLDVNFINVSDNLTHEDVVLAAEAENSAAVFSTATPALNAIQDYIPTETVFTEVNPVEVTDGSKKESSPHSTVELELSSDPAADSTDAAAELVILTDKRAEETTTMSEYDNTLNEVSSFDSTVETPIAMDVPDAAFTDMALKTETVVTPAVQPGDSIELLSEVTNNSELQAHETDMLTEAAMSSSAVPAVNDEAAIADLELGAESSGVSVETSDVITGEAVSHASTIIASVNEFDTSDQPSPEITNSTESPLIETISSHDVENVACPAIAAVVNDETMVETYSTTASVPLTTEALVSADAYNLSQENHDRENVITDQQKNLKAQEFDFLDEQQLENNSGLVTDSSDTKN